MSRRAEGQGSAQWRRVQMERLAVPVLAGVFGVAALALGVMTRSQAILTIFAGVAIWWWLWPVVKRRWRLRNLLVHELTGLPIDRLEEVVEDLFRSHGYTDLRRTKDPHGDREDLRCLTREGQPLLIRTQATSSRVGTKDVKDLARTMSHHREIHGAILVTASTYSPQAVAMARHDHIHLVDGYRLASIFALRPGSHPEVEALIATPLVVERHPPPLIAAAVLLIAIVLAWLIWVLPALPSNPNAAHHSVMPESPRVDIPY